MTQGSGHLEFGIDTKTYQPSLLSNDSACLALLVGISDHKAGGMVNIIFVAFYPPLLLGIKFLRK
jgi:hypothetical protein